MSFSNIYIFYMKSHFITKSYIQAWTKFSYLHIISYFNIIDFEVLIKYLYASLCNVAVNKNVLSNNIYTHLIIKKYDFFSLGWEKCVNSTKHTKDPYHTHAFEWNVHKRRSTLYILYPSNIICCFWCCKICGKAVWLKFFYSDKWWYTFCLMQHCPHWITNYIFTSFMIWFLLIFSIKLSPTFLHY